MKRNHPAFDHTPPAPDSPAEIARDCPDFDVDYLNRIIKLQFRAALIALHDKIRAELAIPHPTIDRSTPDGARLWDEVVADLTEDFRERLLTSFVVNVARANSNLLPLKD